MKTKILLPILVLVASSLFAADGVFFNRLYFGPSVTANVTYRYLNKNFVPSGSSESEIKGVIDAENKHSYPEVGVTTGLKVGVNITHCFAIESGLQYSWIHYRYYSGQYSYVNQVWTGSGFTATDSFKSNVHNVYHYITIPVALNFTAGKKKVRGIFSFGTNFDFLIKKRIAYTQTYADGHKVSSSSVDSHSADFRKFNLSPFIGMGIDCYLGKTFVLRVMPVAQMQALKNVNAPITEYLWNVGLNVSLLVGFLHVN